jgi:hypothetical protein
MQQPLRLKIKRLDKNAVIAVLCTAEQKNNYTIAANGEKLQLWILRTLDLASK